LEVAHESIDFLVEGETEQEFVNRILAPYLVTKGLNTEIRPIMIEKSGGGHGYSNIEHLKNTIRPVLNKVDEPIVTTLIDHYGINSEHKLPVLRALQRQIRKCAFSKWKIYFNRKFRR
jgi:hypothetical protein